ncbi:very short patch repair endonuclease [Streptosporangium sp. 'caverna']|nr:very short patch repair endonuclease [Streptosporangium sp. 'caverna']
MAVERPTRAFSEGVRKSMQGNRGRDTKPELALRRAAHALGLRYRVSVRPLPNLRCTADMVFTRAKVAVFMDGCFWHGCPEHHTKSATNAEYWAEKFRKNRELDAKNNRVLAEAGWTVIRFWEHEDPISSARRIAEQITFSRQKREAEAISGSIGSM